MGLKSQVEGKGFEEYFSGTCNRFGFAWIKIPLGARIYGQDRFGKPLYTLTRAPFDFAIAGILNGFPIAAYIDCKSINAYKYGKSLIDWAQVNDLLRFEEVGHPAGYLIYFRKAQKIVFFKASYILKIQGDLKLEEGLVLGDLFDFDLTRLWK